MVILMFCNTFKIMAVEKPALEKKDVNMAIGSTYKISVKNVKSGSNIKYKVKKGSIAKVSAKGIITALKPGKTVVAVVIKNGKDSYTLSCNVTVKKPAFEGKPMQNTWREL